MGFEPSERDGRRPPALPPTRCNRICIGCVCLRACVRACDSQSLIVKAEATFSLPEAELNAFVDKVFAFSYIWSIAGSVEGDG